MCLKDFIEKFVCKNTLIRLWTEIPCGHKMITDGDTEVGMEWQITDGTGWQSKYCNRTVIGVTDIVCNSYNAAVNIVIE